VLHVDRWEKVLLMTWFVGGMILIGVLNAFWNEEVSFFFAIFYLSFWIAFTYGFVKGMRVGREDAEKEFKGRR